ncbi:SRPBCC family protein [Flavobacterium sp. 7A]|uniref:SRPBCC family protein n=1 Tax=Flavobacterium sp. 7A TaxID=2940571 RepID=UPI002226F41C|nr:SRPBCC family protein [Flavobacterium sp. 7A]MCW2120189.1 effector-binding domain-containing protein [Flavobacterium sp. 7A]
MRILKYIFLLILLSFVALSIFIATQKGEFNIERSKVINSSQSSVYNYVIDYKNWEDFGSWAEEDPEMKFIYGEKTIGKGASFSWEGKDGDGEMTTIFTKENDSISQKMIFNNSLSVVSWKFKDTIGGTKVTWRTKGNMSFMLKIYAAFMGGPDAMIGKMYEKSLNNLDKTLDYEINTFAVTDNGIVKRPIIYYLYQSFTTEISKVIKNSQIVTPKITAFCEENNIEVIGKPFVIYQTYDLTKNIAKVSICIPILKEIFISPGSDILSGKLEAGQAVKVTLTGDYTHSQKAYEKALAFVNKNQIKVDPKISHVELFITGKDDIKNPSKWVSETYIPLFQTYIAPVKTPATQGTTESIPEHELTETTAPVTGTSTYSQPKPVAKPKLAPVKVHPLPATTSAVKKIEVKKIEIKKPVPVETDVKDENSEF